MARPAHSTEQKNAIRNKIRAAASRLYRQQGMSKLSARSVATEAGVSVGTLYAYFGSLSELMQSLWREPVRRLIADMEQLAPAQDCPKARLKALMLALVTFSQENPSVFRNSFLFVRPETMEAPPQIALDRDRFFQLYRSTIREGQETGLFRAGDLDDLTQTVISGVHGSLALPINLHRLALDASERVPAMMVDAMLDWLGGGE